MPTITNTERRAVAHLHRGRQRVGRTRSTTAGLIGIAVVLSTLWGCTSVPRDLGRSDVDALVGARGVDTEPADEALLQELTAAPLSAASAVRIALINNPQLQSTYATLGFGAADLYAAGRIRNPVFSGAFLDSNASGERAQITYGVVTSISDLITLRARKRLSAAAFTVLQQQVSAEVMATAARAERAYYRYAGRLQVEALRRQIAEAATLTATLAQRYRDAGNLTRRELALERAAASQAQVDAVTAQADALAARTELANVLGLSVGASWSVPARLLLPVTEEDNLDTLLALAERSRLDLAAARSHAALLADQLGVVNWTRWLGDLSGGGERERETDGVKLTGGTVDWEVPVFNQHRDQMLRARAELEMAVNDVRRLSVEVDNGVRLAHAAVQNALARVAEYRDVLIPQRMEAVARAQEEVNYMLIGVFELLALKQQEYDTYVGYLETLSEYWQARSDLTLATGTALPSNARIGSKAVSPDDFIRPQGDGMHSSHGGAGMGSMHDHSMHMGHEAPSGTMQDHDRHEMPAKANSNEGSGHGSRDHSMHHMPAAKAPANASDPVQPDHGGHDAHNHDGGL